MRPSAASEPARSKWEGQLVRVGGGVLAVERLQRARHVPVQHACAGQPQLCVERLPYQRMGEVVPDFTAVQALANHPVRAELVHSGQEIRLLSFERRSQLTEAHLGAPAPAGQVGGVPCGLGETPGPLQHRVPYGRREGQILEVPSHPCALAPVQTSLIDQRLQRLLHEERVPAGPCVAGGLQNRRSGPCPPRRPSRSFPPFRSGPEVPAGPPEPATERPATARWGPARCSLRGGCRCRWPTTLSGDSTDWRTRKWINSSDEGSAQCRSSRATRRGSRSGERPQQLGEVPVEAGLQFLGRAIMRKSSVSGRTQGGEEGVQSVEPTAGERDQRALVHLPKKRNERVRQ